MLPVPPMNKTFMLPPRGDALCGLIVPPVDALSATLDAADKEAQQT
jgi:hypothetical protein